MPRTPARAARKVLKTGEWSPENSADICSRGRNRPLPQDRPHASHEAKKTRGKRHTTPVMASKKRCIIDLTGSDSDENKSSKKPSTKVLQSSNRVPGVADVMKHRTNPISQPLPAASRQAAWETMNVHDTTRQKILDRNGSFQRARVDDAEDRGTPGEIKSSMIEAYHMIPREIAAPSVAGTICNEGSTCHQQRQQHQQHNCVVSESIQQTDNKAPLPQVEPRSNSPKPEVATAITPKVVKIENVSTPAQPPPRSASTFVPLLAEKMKLVREFGETFGVAEHEAYRQLLAQDWNVDSAALAFLEMNGKRGQAGQVG